MEQFITWCCSEPRLALNRAVVLRFRLHLESLGLAAGTINQTTNGHARPAREEDELRYSSKETSNDCAVGTEGIAKAD